MLHPVDQAKIDLVTALRWAHRCGLGEGICNHFSLAVPGREDHFLLNPQGLQWREVAVSDLLVVDGSGNVVEGKHRAEATAFFIHAAIHRTSADAACVLHTHMPYATVLCCLEGEKLQCLHQNSTRFYGRVRYVESFNGLALEGDEGTRLAREMDGARVLFLANHGVIVIGPDVATAFDDLYYLERACMIQVMARSTGSPMRLISPAVCQRTADQFEEIRRQSHLHLESARRVLQREEPGAFA
jgi:ribulose-5-phosphate 4-epimerase/fuculose-1-phosphate aldolase